MPANSSGGGSSATAVTSTAVIADNAIVRGDGGARGIQGSSLSVADFNGDISGPVTVSNTSAVGGGFTNQPAGDTITLVSSNAGDTTQQATILYSLAGVVSLENIALNGTTPVVSTAVPDKLLALVLNASCAGTITAKETSGGLTITTITTTNLSKGLFNFTSMDGYGRQFFLVASGATTKDVGIGGFNTAGATQYGFNTLAGTTPVLSSASFGSASQLYIGDVENTVTVTISSRGGVRVTESLIVGSGLDAAGTVTISANTITAEGATANAFETTLAFGDATADATATFTADSGGAHLDLGAGALATPALSFGDADTGIYMLSSQRVAFTQNAANRLLITSTGVIADAFQLDINTGDTTINRKAAGVAGMASGNWFQQTSGRVRLTSDFTNATTTMSNTALSLTLIAGRKYSGRLVLYVNDSVAAEGIKVDFDGGAATMTSFRAHGKIFDAALLLSTQTTAIATDLVAATMTGDALVEVDFSLVCNAAGTFIVRAAQNTHATGTLTAYTNSYVFLEDMP